MIVYRRALDGMDRAFDDRFTRAPDYELSLRMSYLYPIDYVDEPLIKWRMYEPSDKPWKKDLVTREEEVIASVENLISLYPEIKSQYANELKRFYTQMDYSSGITAWQKGNSSHARGYLRGICSLGSSPSCTSAPGSPHLPSSTSSGHAYKQIREGGQR